MKYYTKDWYYLMQNLNLAMDMEPVLDKEYTEEDLQEMYQQALAQSVENNTKLYALMGRSVDVADLIADFEKAFTEKCQHVLDRYPEVRQIELITDNTPKTVAFYKSLGFTEFSEMGCCGFMRC